LLKAGETVLDIEAERIPVSPGVYLFEDASGEVLYVGKAASLRPRVRSYFGLARGKSDRTRAMMERAAAVRFIVTDTEMEALALESNLIKRHKPRYNITLRDDKNYPYIKVSTGEKWPRATLARQAKKDGARYFGPYYPANTVHETLRLCRWLYPFRTCSDRVLATAARSCLNFHIGRCMGPCQDRVTREEYTAMVREMCLFLEGRHAEVRRILQERMAKRSEALDFEGAARLRDQIAAIDRLREEQKVISTSSWEQDVVGLAQEEHLSVVLVMFVREGKLVGQKPYILRDTSEVSTGEILSAFLGQHYADSPAPAEVLLPQEPEELGILAKWLGTLGNGRCCLAVPKRGEKRRLVEMASRNASVVLEGALLEEPSFRANEDLAAVLGLKSPPRRIECFDISNLQGKQPVGSMVVSVDGETRKDLYRRFKVKTGDKPDDYRMMREVVERRLKRGLSGEVGAWGLPDLIVLDGGKAHLGVVLRALEEMNLSLPLAALAKEEERLHVPGLADPLELPRNSPALRHLMRLRDEAHRFALGYHRSARSAQNRRSRLDEIPGVGPRRKRALLKAFGSVKGLARASVDEIARVPGVGRNLAQAIRDHLGD
jgi:excinuclease ABC subunit C